MLPVRVQMVELVRLRARGQIVQQKPVIKHERDLKALRQPAIVVPVGREHGGSKENRSWAIRGGGYVTYSGNETRGVGSSGETSGVGNA